MTGHDEMFRRMTRAELTDTARGIVTNDLLVADMSRHEWQMSLALLLSGLEERDFQRIGLILVPMGPHHHLYWINNTAPGCSFSCRFVHINDLSRLAGEVARMDAALHPEAV